MNRLKYYLLLGLAGILFTVSGCQKGFLSQVPNDRISLPLVFQRKNLSRQYLANIYDYIRNEAFKTTGGAAPWDILSQDMNSTYARATNPSFVMNLGSWTVSDYYYNYWPYYYEGIRKATYFMNHIMQNDDPTLSDHKKTRWQAEARFLRAWFYFCLLRQYGPVILVGDHVISPDKPSFELQWPRTPYDKCVNYIAAQLDSAAMHLPLDRAQQTAENYGRATKEMAWAVKARMLLYAASPQFNGNTMYANFVNPDGTHLINQTYDEGKWKRAAKASKKIIDSHVYSLYIVRDSKGNIDPYLSEQNVFLDPWNNSVIFARPGNNLQHAERTQTPVPARGYAGLGVTQSLVDAFAMENGELPITGYKSDGSPIINPASGYSETGFSMFQAPGDDQPRKTFNMWVNREPRFYVNVYYDGADWINDQGNNNITYESNYSGSSGKKQGQNHTRTGYLAKKNVDPETDFRGSTQFTPRPYVMFRYAEVLLNYVEALNEYDPGNPAILKYLNKIRERAGVPDIPPGLSQGEMRKNIHHERRVELAEENLRYFDTRRWLIAKEVDSGPFYGMNVNADGNKFYQRHVFETRVFKKAYYLFPIYQRLLDRNDNLVQSPFW